MKKTKNLNYYLSLAYQLQLTKIQVEDGDGYLAEIPIKRVYE